MQTTFCGGLNGKARILRSRNRASRLYVQQLLDEYVEPDSVAPRREHYIPIRTRSEFLPAVTTWCDEHDENDKGFATGGQLELPLCTDAPAGQTAGSETLATLVRALPVKESPTPSPTTGDAVDCGATAPTVEAISAVPRRSNEETPMKWVKPRASFQPASGWKPQNGFDLHRFLYGCLLGGAAAAVFLLAVNVLFG